MTEVQKENSQEQKHVVEDEASKDDSKEATMLKNERENVEETEDTATNEAQSKTEDDEAANKKDSIFLNPNVTPQEILQKYQTVKQKNEDHIKAILRKEGRLLETQFTPPLLTDTMSAEVSLQEAEHSSSIPISEEKWNINPSSLTMEPPYIIMDTIELRSKMSEERPFRAIVSKNPSDWTLSILPDTGLLSSHKVGDLLIICESKNVPLPEKKSLQKGIVQIFLEDEMKELEVCINYMPVQIGKLIPAKPYPGRSPPKSHVYDSSRKTEAKNTQKMKKKKSDEPSDIPIIASMSAIDLDTPLDDYKRKITGIKLNHIKAMENLNDSLSLTGKTRGNPNSSVQKKTDNKSAIFPSNTRKEISNKSATIKVKKTHTSKKRFNQIGDLISKTESKGSNNTTANKTAINYEIDNLMSLSKKKSGNIIGQCTSLTDSKIVKQNSTNKKLYDTDIRSFNSLSTKKMYNKQEVSIPGNENTKNLISKFIETGWTKENNSTFLLTKPADNKNISLSSKKKAVANISVPTSRQIVIDEVSNPFIMKRKKATIKGIDSSSVVTKTMKNSGPLPQITKLTNIKSNTPNKRTMKNAISIPFTNVARYNEHKNSVQTIN